MTAAHGREVDPERVERVAPWHRRYHDSWSQCACDKGADHGGPLAADTGEAQQAVERVRALLTKLDAHPMPDFPGYAPRSYAVAIRAALDGAE